MPQLQSAWLKAMMLLPQAQGQAEIEAQETMSGLGVGRGCNLGTRWTECGASPTLLRGLTPGHEQAGHRLTQTQWSGGMLMLNQSP